MRIKGYVLAAVLALVAAGAGADSWYNPPGGTATTVNPTDQILINQGGVSRVAPVSAAGVSPTHFNAYSTQQALKRAAALAAHANYSTAIADELAGKLPATSSNLASLSGDFTGAGKVIKGDGSLLTGVSGGVQLTGNQTAHGAKTFAFTNSTTAVTISGAVATPATTNGFATPGAQITRQTVSGADVQSGAALQVTTPSYSRNSVGTANDNKTNQVAIVANASAMDSQASASVVAINAIGESLYTGSGTQTVNPIQADVATHRTPGFFGDANKPYAVGISSINVGPNDGTAGVVVDTAVGGQGFLHGALISGAKNSAVTIAANTVTPDTGVWVSAAKTYGIYVGPKSLYQVNPGQTPTYDSDHNPTIGIALGQRAASSGSSQTLRFESADSGGTPHAYDLYTSYLNDLSFFSSGSLAALLDHTGSFYATNSLYAANSINANGSAYVGGSAHVFGDISAAHFYGDGSHLTGVVTSSNIDGGTW